MSLHRLGRPLLNAVVLVLGLVACSAWGAEEISTSDRQALREFRLNRLFAMLGYLEQRASNVGFPWNEVGYGEAGNAWSGVTEAGEKLAPSVRELVRKHEEKHRSNLAQEFGRTFAGSLTGEGVKALAKVELKHALEDLQTIDSLLASQPEPTAEELERLRQQQADLVRRFQPKIPGLEAVGGGFTEGGSYKSQAYPDADSTIYLSEYVKPSRTSSATNDGSVDARQAALAEARESLERIRALVGYVAASRQRLVEQVETARKPHYRGLSAYSMMEKIKEKGGGLMQRVSDLDGQLQSLATATAALEESYRKLAELGAQNEQQAATICNYARQANDSPAKQVSTWKAEANLTVHQMASGLESCRGTIDAHLAEVTRCRKAITALFRQLNLDDVMSLELSSFAEAREAQVQSRAALGEAQATKRDMTTAIGQIKQEQKRIEDRLRPYAGDEEADRIGVEVQQLVANMVDPEATFREECLEEMGRPGEPEWISADLSQYNAIEEALRTLDMTKFAARINEAVEEAEAVQTVGEAKAAPAYGALQQALACFGKIQGGTAETPAPPSSTPVASPPVNEPEKQTVWVLKEAVSNPANLPTVYHPWPNHTYTMSLSGAQGGLHVVSLDTGNGAIEYDWQFEYKYSPAPPTVLKPGDKFDVRVSATAGGGKQDFVIAAAHVFNTSGIKYEYQGKFNFTDVGRFDVGRPVVGSSDGVFHCQVEERPYGDTIWLEMGIFYNGSRPFVRYVYEKREVGSDELKQLSGGQ